MGPPVLPGAYQDRGKDGVDFPAIGLAELEPTADPVVENAHFLVEFVVDPGNHVVVLIGLEYDFQAVSDQAVSADQMGSACLVRRFERAVFSVVRRYGHLFLPCRAC